MSDKNNNDLNEIEEENNNRETQDCIDSHNPISSPDIGTPAITGTSKQKLSAAVCIILAIIIMISFAITAHTYVSAKTLKETAETETTTEDPAAVSTTDIFASLKPNQNNTVYPKGILEKYKNMYSFNHDIVGWLKIPNTSIDTVVTQDDNNRYYLKTDFYGNYTRYGNAFLDCRNNAKNLNQNNIIYGHTTEYPRQQVFSDLSKYKNYKFFIKNPIIEYGTLYADYEWKVCSVFISTVDPSDDNGYYFYYIQTDFDSADFYGYLFQMKQYCLYNTGVDIKSTDKLLTLSTCTYDNNFSGREINSRLVVVARLLRKGESKEIDASKVTVNTDWRRPQVWYNHFGLNNPYKNYNNWE